MAKGKMVIQEGMVFVNQKLKSREEVIHFTADAADKLGLLNDKEAYIKAVFQRETEISTSIGYGIAIPHGKTDAVKEAFIGYVGVDDTFQWDEATGDQVKTIFMIGVPMAGTDMLHLKCIAAISQKLIDDDFRAKLRECKTSAEAFGMLDAINHSI